MSAHAGDRRPSRDRKPSRDRWHIGVCLIGTLCFVCCYSIAIALYPGGTWWDADAEGHSLSRNFLCDLMQTDALNGVAAPTGSLLARLGMFAMLIGVVAFYSQIARLESPISRTGWVAERVGLVACVAGAAIPIVTSELWRLGHLIAVLTAFFPSLIAATAALLICLRTRGVPTLVRVAGVVTLTAGALDGFAYLFFHTSPMLGLVPESRETRMLITASLPLLQRIAVLGFIAWTLVTSAHSFENLRRSAAAARAKG